MQTKREVILAYLAKHNLEYKELNEQINIKKSPITGEEKRNHFYIGMNSGLRDDKKAGKSGNWYQFQELMGDMWAKIELPEGPESIVGDKEAKQYKKLDSATILHNSQILWSIWTVAREYLLNTRGLTPETIKHFRLGAKEDGRIAIPILSPSKEVYNIRRRKSPTDTQEDRPKYRTESWCETRLFNEVALYSGTKEIFLTEWEFDAMSLYQMGLPNVISTTLWASSFPDKWVEQFKDIERVFICYDSDEAGEEGVKKVVEKLGKDRCFLLKIPQTGSGKRIDINDFLVAGGTKEQFIEFKKDAKRTGSALDAIKHISEFNQELRDKLLNGDYRGISTGYGKLDEILGGFRKGRLVIVSGLTSTGKTTFSQNLSLSLSCRGVSNVFISMEMPPLDICKKFLMLHKKISGKALEGLLPTDPIMTLVDEGLAEFIWAGGQKMPLYVFDWSWEVQLEQLKELCRVAVSQHGTQVIFVDHLHYFGHASANRATEIAHITRQIKSIAMELDVCVVLLAHLNRGGRSKERKWFYVPALSDLKDAGAIEQDADQVVFVCRDSESPDELAKRKTVIKVAKNRDGSTWYVSNDFDLDTWCFSEVIGADYMEEAGGSSGRGWPKKSGGRDVGMLEPPEDALF